MNVLKFFDTDGYKPSQWKQYPEGMTGAMVYGEARGPEGGYTIFFGLQSILNQLKVPTLKEVDLARMMAYQYFGRDDVFNYEGWKKIAEMGYFPLKIRAVKEGSKIPNGNALFTVENTHGDFAWLPGWFETQLMRVWYPTNVATLSHEIKTIINKYLVKNGTPETLPIKLHDFGSRGSASQQAAAIGGMGHLVNFNGTDTLAAVVQAVDDYDAGASSLAMSIPASEHSTITSWGKDFEIDAFRNMINQFGGPGKIYACVSDSYDIWAALDKWKALEPLILEKGGTLVVRPDSGDPVETPVAVVHRLMERFGYSLNDNGYKVLPDHIRVIQGDGIDKDTIKAILERLDRLNISSDNINFGMGGALLQKHDRDTHKFAVKMCGCVVDGQPREVFKDPVTDPGKRSKAGFLTTVRDSLTGEIKTVHRDTLESEEAYEDIMDTVFENNTIITQKFEDIRARANVDFV